MLMINQYEEEKTKKQKRFDKIMVLLVLALMISIILWVIFGITDNTRTHFTRAQTAAHEINYDYAEETNELLVFYNQVKTNTLIYDKSFEATYPKLNEVIDDLDFFSSDIDIKTIDAGGYLAVIDGYSISYDFSVRGIDILLIPYNTRLDGERVFVKVDKPIRYTVIYNSAMATIEYSGLDEKNYRLSFYTMDIAFTTPGNLDFCNAAYNLNLNTPLSEKQIKNNSYGKYFTLTDSNNSNISMQNNSEGSQANGAAAVSAEFSNQIKLTIKFNDDLYTSFDSLEYTIESKGITPEGSSYLIGVN